MLIVAKALHPPKIISLSRVLPTVRIVNVAGGHNDTEKAFHLGDVGIEAYHPCSLAKPRRAVEWR